MINFPSSILATGGARTGIAPVNLLDVMDTNGNQYYWADRAVNAIPPVIPPPAVGGVVPSVQSYLPWIDSVGEIKIYRSLQTDTCSFSLQNVSGDSMARDFERIARRSALEGAFFVFRIFQTDALAALFEMHGTLTVTHADDTEVQIKGNSLPLDASQVDGLPMSYSESCQLDWASARCGIVNTGQTPCQQSFQTCQVVERYTGILNTFEKNYGEATATVSSKVINRMRKV
jgi:hypothetical protein